MDYNYESKKFIIIASISGFIFLLSCIAVIISCVKNKYIDDSDLDNNLNNDLEENFVEDITDKKIENVDENIHIFDNSMFTYHNNILTFHETETDL